MPGASIRWQSSGTLVATESAPFVPLTLQSNRWSTWLNPLLSCHLLCNWTDGTPGLIRSFHATDLAVEQMEHLAESAPFVPLTLQLNRWNTWLNLLLSCH